MKNEKQSNPTSDVISQLRLPLIILVTYAHSYGQVDEGYRLLSSDWDTYQFLKLLVSQTLVKVVVPVFFIISGYLFFANVREWSVNVYRQKIIRRFKTLLLPYLLWNLLMAVKLRTFSWNMFWVYGDHAGMQIDWLGNENWMTAPANMPLWFLRDLMVVSLLTPIIYILLKRFGWYVMTPLTLLYLSGVGAFAIPGLSMYSVFFFSLGAFISIRKMDLVTAMLHYETTAYAASLLLAVLMMVSFGTSIFSSLMLCFRITGAVSVFCLAKRLLSSTNLRIPKIVSDSSYFIYLAHYVFFLSFLDQGFFQLFGQSQTGLCVHYLLCPLLKAALFVVVYVVISSLGRLFVQRLPRAGH